MALLSNYPVNRSDYQVIKGVQNEILFFVRDLDRNPVNTSGFQTVTINIVDHRSGTLLLSRALTVVDPSTALYMLTVLPTDTINWSVGPLRWSLMVTRNDGSSVMLWTDMNYSPYSYLEVSDGPVPGPAQPVTLTPSTFSIANGYSVSPNLPGSAQLGYQNGMQTLALYPSSFSGSVEVDASLLSQPSGDQSDWFIVATETYHLVNTVQTINLTGNFIWMRVRVQATAGSLAQILYKN